MLRKVKTSKNMMSTGRLEKTFNYGKFQTHKKIGRQDEHPHIRFQQLSITIIFIYIPTSTHKLGYFRAKHK